MNDETNATINAVLTRWGLSGGVVESAPDANHGFSGVDVWRVRIGQERFALRRLSASLADAERATQTHRLMRYAARVLDFVPWPRSTDDGQTVAFHESVFWSLETWAPGEPVEAPSVVEVELAATALWMFHEVTHDSRCFGEFDEEGRCEAIRRRKEALAAGPPAPFGFDRAPALRLQAERLQNALPAALERALPLVSAAEPTPTRRQPIIGDVRRAHVLFSRERVTGLVDYGAATTDSPLVDLARMLGELAGDDSGQWSAGIAAYQMLRPLTEPEKRLLVALDAGGVVGASIRWLRWLEQGTVAPTPPVAARMGELADRLEVLSRGKSAAERALESWAT